MTHKHDIKTEIVRFWTDKFKTIGMFASCFALLLLAVPWFQPVVKSEADLQSLSGRLDSYSFRDGSRGSRYYILKIDGIGPGFQIPAEFLDNFEKPAFQREVHIGDRVTIEYPKVLENSLGTRTRPVYVFSINSNGKSYLYKYGSIEIYNSNNLFLWFVLLSGVLLLGGRSAYLTRHPEGAVSLFN